MAKVGSIDYLSCHWSYGDDSLPQIKLVNNEVYCPMTAFIGADAGLLFTSTNWVAVKVVDIVLQPDSNKIRNRMLKRCI